LVEAKAGIRVFGKQNARAFETGRRLKLANDDCYGSQERLDEIALFRMASKRGVDKGDNRLVNSLNEY